MDFQKLVREEMERARSKWGTFHNHHEAYAVLLEEVEEYWAEVKVKESMRNSSRMREELVQVAAIAQRIAEDLL